MKNFPVETVPQGVEHFLAETVHSNKNTDSVYWQQGYFYFNNQKRIATVTDVKFISKNLLVVAHRAAAKLYLIELKDDVFNVLHSIVLDFQNPRNTGKRFSHPDLITIHGNSVYMSEYTNMCCVVDVIEKKLVLNNIFQIGEPAYHGCFSTKNSILFGAVKDGDVAIFDVATKSIKSVNTGIDRAKRIKTIGMDKNNYVLGVDVKKGLLKRIRPGLDSWFNLYEFSNNEFIELDSLEFPNTQIDGHVSHEGFHFLAMHDGEYKCGVIVVLTITNNKINVVRKIKCESFPHGIDVCDGKLIYTSYANSSIVLHPLSDFFGAG